jgi:tRNA A-37 threonylcarbamoyl transferase component Bud32
MTMRTRGDRIFLQRFFLDQEACTVLRQDAHKTLLRAHNQGKRGEDLFIKIYRYPHRIRSRMVDWKFVGGGHEYRMCIKLNTLGVATPEPIGFAVDRNAVGYPRQSLYASKWLNDSQTLDAMIRNVGHHPPISKESWPTILYALGRFVGFLHGQLINAKDLNTKNLMVKMQGEGPVRFFLVDYERITFLKKYDLARFMNGLSQLGAGLIPGCEDAVEWICRGYVTRHPGVEKEDLVGQVTQASRDKIRQWRQEMDGFFARIGDEMHRRKDQERQ